MCDDVVLSDNSKGLTKDGSAACTNACTSNPENGNAGTAGEGNEAKGSSGEHAEPLAAIANALAGLSNTDRQRLAEMLLQDSGNE